MEGDTLVNEMVQAFEKHEGTTHRKAMGLASYHYVALATYRDVIRKLNTNSSKLSLRDIMSFY